MNDLEVPKLPHEELVVHEVPLPLLLPRVLPTLHAVRDTDHQRLQNDAKGLLLVVGDPDARKVVLVLGQDLGMPQQHLVLGLLRDELEGVLEQVHVLPGLPQEHGEHLGPRRKVGRVEGAGQGLAPLLPLRFARPRLSRLGSARPHRVRAVDVDLALQPGLLGRGPSLLGLRLPLAGGAPALLPVVLPLGTLHRAVRLLLEQIDVRRPVRVELARDGGQARTTAGLGDRGATSLALVLLLVPELGQGLLNVHRVARRRGGPALKLHGLQQPAADLPPDSPLLVYHPPVRARQQASRDGALVGALRLPHAVDRLHALVHSFRSPYRPKRRGDSGAAGAHARTSQRRGGLWCLKPPDGRSRGLTPVRRGSLSLSLSGVLGPDRRTAPHRRGLLAQVRTWPSPASQYWGRAHHRSIEVGVLLVTVVPELVWA